MSKNENQSSDAADQASESIARAVLDAPVWLPDGTVDNIHGSSASIETPREYLNNGKQPDPELLMGDWFDGDSPPEPVPTIVDDLIPAQGLTILGGQSGAGKTFIAIYLTCALAINGEFFGRSTSNRMGVIYVAAEGRATISPRLAAAKISFAVNENLPISVIKTAPDLSTKQGRDKLIKKVRAHAFELHRRYGVTVGAVVIDTISAAFAIKDENSAGEMNAIYKGAEEIGDSIGAATIALAHYGKNTETGLRGSSAGRDRGESVLAVLADRNETTGKVKDRRVVHIKSRVGEEGTTFGFDLVGVEIGINEMTGQGLYAAHVVLTGKPETRSEARKLSDSEQHYLRALLEGLDEAGEMRRPMDGMPEVKVVLRTRVRDIFFPGWPADGETDRKKYDARRKAFNRGEAGLRTLNRVGYREVSGVEWVWLIRDEL